MTTEYEPGGMFGHAAVRQGNYVVVFGGKHRKGQPLPLWEINIYNIYTAEWRLHVIPDRQTAPSQRMAHCAVAIGGSIYMFGGYLYLKHIGTNEVWTLTETSKGCFVWRQIMFEHKEKTPSPRAYHSTWEYGGNLWIFGGRGTSSDGYLSDHGEFEPAAVDEEDYENNQLFCFDPSGNEWTNIKCSGKIPDPQAGPATTITEDKVWLFGCCEDNHDNKWFSSLSTQHEIHGLDSDRNWS